MQGVNYMILSRESMVEIVEAHMKKLYGEEVKVESFLQRKHHNVFMFEVKMQTGKDERTPTDKA